MSQTIIKILKLEPPYYDVDNPNQTLYIDATAAQSLGIEGLIQTGELQGVVFKVGSRSQQMDAILLSLEFPTGNIIRLTEQALKYFGLASGKNYWVNWNQQTRTLKVLRTVNGK